MKAYILRKPDGTDLIRSISPDENGVIDHLVKIHRKRQGPGLADWIGTMFRDSGWAIVECEVIPGKEVY